jgi:general secretion pathway protein D
MTPGAQLAAGTYTRDAGLVSVVIACGSGGFGAGTSTANSPVTGLGGPAGANSPATSALGQGGQPGGVTTVAAGGAVIAADPSTNSLIITAPEPIYRNLRSVIDKLDARRVQVYIESLIVEVSADRSIELQVVCSAEVAERIAEHVLAQYAPNYAVALYLSDVQVFRAQKY